MDLQDYAAQNMSDRTGCVWVPVRVDNVDASYIISEHGDVYNFRKRKMLQPSIHQSTSRKFKYIRLRSNGKQIMFQLDALLLSIFPEKYDTDHAQEWRRIVFGGELTDYEVSESGVVRRINNHHIIKPAVHKDGYHVIRIRHCGKTITEYAHRLVAAAFIPNPNEYEIVNHKDENRQNNSVSNLEWCDRRYNMLYNGAAKRAGLHAAMTKRLRRNGG